MKKPNKKYSIGDKIYLCINLIFLIIVFIYAIRIDDLTISPRVVAGNMKIICAIFMVISYVIYIIIKKIINKMRNKK